ncbi:unnamed protein product [Pipistrellus nathusii]|uniref:Uncharacterized protein n=1 Tax=Pipistrellus nathusii TaxID=59473 RepID=A0ABN9ZEU7_PIPNA
MYISECPRARVHQEGFCGSASGGLHPAAACTKDLEDSKGGPGSQPEREDILFNSDTTPTKLRYAHYGYFLYLLLGKSHFKDLCYLEAKLFFFFFFCQRNAVFYYSIMRNNTGSVISFLMKGQTEI